MTVRAIRIGVTSHNGATLGAFYRDAFGFTSAPPMRDEHLPRMLGAQARTAEVLVTRLGDSTVDIATFSPPGQPYPADVAANDVRFQHFAIVVTDMAAAFARLQSIAGWTAISQGGPQRLPHGSGGVTAFKFRDRDGHPLELLEFTGGAPKRWRDCGPGPFLGIDHSAITVADTRRSVAFYGEILGLSVAGTSLNHGPEQERLDSVPNAVVEVTSLRAAASTSIGIELLRYARSAATPPPVGPTDVAATRLTLEVDNLDEAAARLVRYHASPVTGIGDIASGPGFAALDPDGHHLLFVSRS